MGSLRKLLEPKDPIPNSALYLFQFLPFSLLSTDILKMNELFDFLQSPGLSDMQINYYYARTTNLFPSKLQHFYYPLTCYAYAFLCDPSLDC